MSEKKKTLWYAAGLHFECRQCGGCCSGPNQGYIWITRPEIKLIAEFLKIEPKQLRQKYLRRVGLRTTIIEQKHTKDCIFLQKIDGQKRCAIYSVRPNQCRTWPFWPENLVNPDEWNRTALKCSGINRGRLYRFEEIEKIKKSRKWQNLKTNNQPLKRVFEIYKWLDLQINNNSNPSEMCTACGKCCDFSRFDHLLFVTAPEFMYLAAELGADNIKPMTAGICPYNKDGKCTVYEYRFAGCRIFSCKGDKDFQSALSEKALKEFKTVCEQFQIPYRYTDLAAALNGPSSV